MSKTTFRQWLSNIPLPIEAIRFTTSADWGYDSEENSPWFTCPKNQLLTPDQIDPKWLDLKFDRGFGAQYEPDIMVWTRDKVYFTHEYDGSTRLASVPRHPSIQLESTPA